MWTQDSTHSLICIDTWNNQKEGYEFLTQFYCCSVDKLWLSMTPWTAAHQASLSSTVSWSLLKFMSIESVMLCNHLILCHSLFLLPSIFPRSRVFSNESTLCIRWPKYWSFSISPSNEYSGFISFRIDWFDLHRNTSRIQKYNISIIQSSMTAYSLSLMV